MTESDFRVEFQVNSYIKLRLENKKTYIYVAGERFSQCKFLLLYIPIDEMASLDEIDSIDGAYEDLNKSLQFSEDETLHPDFRIPPEVEFWGHCSNLQVWAENDYDTRLLHSNIAFPLLKRLTEVGDVNAKNVFKDEIAKRFSSGTYSVMLYLINMGYIDLLEREELRTLIYSMPEIFSRLRIHLISCRDETSEELLYSLIETIKKDYQLLNNLIINPGVDIINNLILILSYSKIDELTRDLIIDVFELLNNSPNQTKEIINDRFMSLLEKGELQILFEFFYDRLFKYLNQKSIERINSNTIFKKGLACLIGKDLKFILDGVLEFFNLNQNKIIYIKDLLKSIYDIDKVKLRKNLEERLEMYLKRDDMYWENRKNLIIVAKTVLKLIKN